MYPQSLIDLSELSQDELKHMNMLHNTTVNMVRLHEADPDPRTEGMKLAYQILHERAMEKEKGVRIMHDMFRE